MDLRGKVKFLTGGDGSFLVNEPQPATRCFVTEITTDLVQFQGRR